MVSSLVLVVALGAEPTDPVLRAELLIMRDTDQAARRALFGHDPDGEWGEMVTRFDDRNRVRLKEIIGAKGWPTAAQVGEDGAEAAWVLALHLANDPELQQRCLALLTEVVKKKQAPPEQLARLTDKVLLQQGKPQRYGTQLAFPPDGGAEAASPVEDAPRLDARRKALGLGPWAQYRTERRKGYDELARAADGGR